MAVQLDVLPLEAGDRLSRAEFHRRYLATPRIKKAELVQGIVYVPSPLQFTSHAEPHADMIGWVQVYRANTPGIRVADNATLILGEDNELQPDVIVCIDEALGGRSRRSRDDFLEGPPELIIEIASSSASYDLHAKREIYERHGVQEYLVWRTRDRAIDWWERVDGRYRPLVADDDGRVSSQVLPGLVLDVPAMLAGDLARVLEIQQSDHGSRDHQEFVNRLDLQD